MTPATPTKARPLVMTADEVRATRLGTKRMFRQPISPRNSTCLGYPAKSYWPGLLFEHAIVRQQASLMVALVGSAQAPDDPHLSVPYRHPKDPPVDKIDDLARYRVRPIWGVGGELWVRERHSFPGGDFSSSRMTVNYAADDKSYVVFCPTWPQTVSLEIRPANHLPRWASRLTLRIESVKVERLQAISEADAIAEGCDGNCGIGHIPSYQAGPHAYHFAQVWEASRGAGSWKANPFVWAVKFVVLTEGTR